VQPSYEKNIRVMAISTDAAIDLKAWERHVALADGLAVFIRPIRPDDEKLYDRFLVAVTPEDARFRFLAPVGKLSHALVNYFTHLDYARAMAFIALDERSGDMLGVARLHDRADEPSAEYAVIVRSDLKSHGLGWQLMQITIDYARAKGLRMIEGQVLHENTTMLKMCHELGFEIEMDAKDPAISNVRLAL
jgi:RimJ/RimL family protein N-acetyltransferase